MFSWLLDPYFGIVNLVLNKLGVASQAFFQNPGQALYCIVLVTVWGCSAFAVVIYLAALQGIPRELLEAAEIDGSTVGGRSGGYSFRCSADHPFLVVWLTINSLQLFDEIYVITRGGPLASTTVVVYYLFQQAFAFFQAGYATAIAYVVFLAILA